MIDLNDLRVFESVASRRSFSAAARALGMPNSSVSRSIKRLEARIGTRLVQRTTREVGLTDAGVALHGRCVEMLKRIDEGIDFVSSLGAQPRGLLRISVSIGIGYSVLPELMPDFLRNHPQVDVALELTSRLVDLVAEGLDVTIRMGVLPDSRLVVRRLGTIQLLLCASPTYLEREGVPCTLDELHEHATIEMLGLDGKPRNWMFSNGSNETMKVEIQPRVTVNDPGLIHKLVLNGAGIGCLPAHLCASDIKTGRLIRLLPQWRTPVVEMSVLFPSSRELSPAVRAFVDLLVKKAAAGQLAQVDPAFTTDQSFTVAQTPAVCAPTA